MRLGLAALFGGVTALGAMMYSAGCSSFDAGEELEDAAAESATIPEAGIDAPAPDGAAADAADDARDGGDAGSCKQGSGGPAVVRVLGVCIDRTEVTVEQYAAFVAANSPGVNTPTECAAVDGGFGAACNPGSAPKQPATCVDWCQARAFCAWAGKNLCGSVAGGALAEGDLNNFVVDQWFAACSRGGKRTFPYGNTYEPETCKSADAPGTNAPSSVGSFPACRALPGDPLDLSGNVGEWVNACTGAGPSATCFYRGGGFNRTADQLACAAIPTVGRRSRYNDLGFRCCVD